MCKYRKDGSPLEISEAFKNYEFASEALHISNFENFLKSMTSCLSELKVTPSFCFPFKIPDDLTATNVQ